MCVKLFISLLTLTFFNNLCTGQEMSVGQLTARDFEVLMQIENESTPTKIRELAIELILLSDDKSPLPLMDEAKRLLEISKTKRDPFLECVALSF